MRGLGRRIATIETRAGAGCHMCREWQPVVLLFLTHEEKKDEAVKAAKMPHPSVCPRCGRQVVRLVRQYINAHGESV